MNLFNMKMNVTKCLNTAIYDYLWVGDFYIISRSRYIRKAEPQEYQAIKNID